jgi:hypothetical protein
MKTRLVLMLATLLLCGVPALAADGAPAAAPAPETAAPSVPEALTYIPAGAVGFVLVPDMAALDAGLKRMAEKSGWQVGQGEQPVMDIVARRTGLKAGLDPAGSLCIGYLDPKQYRDRYTIFVLPVADWDALLKSAQGEEMSKDTYALTGTLGPRFVWRRGKYAVVTSSVRTLDAVAGVSHMPQGLSDATRARAAGKSPMAYLNVDRLKRAYEQEISSWFRAATGQMYSEPQAVAYADMLVAYMLGIADFLDQTETAEASVEFGPDGLGLDVAVRFVDGAGVAQFLAAQKPGSTPIPDVGGQTLTSAVTMRVDPATRASFALRATAFFLEAAPRPEPLPEATKEYVYRAVRAFVGSLGEHMTFLSAPAAPGMGLVTNVTVFDIEDAARFREGVELMVVAWERLADQLNLYLRFEPQDDTALIEGVAFTTYVPRLRFGLPARHIQFRQRLRDMYGPEGLIYRVGIVGDRAVVGTGSDLALLRQVVRQLRSGAAEKTPASLERLHRHVPPDQNVFMELCLPLYLGESLRRGGTAADRGGTIDPGKERVGLGLRAEGSSAAVRTWLPYEQIRLTRELVLRAAPELADVPQSLFEPTPEGPPEMKPEATQPPAP